MNKKDFLESFREKLLFDFKNSAQNWWSKCLFHFTDMTNAITIIEGNYIYSRQKANELELMKNDNANDSVVNLTSNEYKKYVRLYFGPNTPTQYANEGIKPRNEISDNAHCPMPVMFVFDFIKIFMLPNIKFTDGNLAKNPTIYEEIEYLKKLDFQSIYHRTWVDEDNREKIVNARHSEILLENRLQVEENLKVLIVRSEAEKETLLYSLSEIMQKKYCDKIFVQS